MTLLFNTKLRKKLLAYSFTHPDEEYYVREVAGIIDEDAGNLSRELRKLEEEGLYKSSRKGSLKLYALNKGYPLFKEVKDIIFKTEGVEGALKKLRSSYKDISFEGWTHANAASRLPNGNTLINLRNFDLTIEVDPQGKVVWFFDCGFLGKYPHEPEILPNGNMVIAIHCPPPGCWDQIVEIERKTKEIVWRFTIPGMKVTRDADRLPNGNTLIVERIKIFEVTPEGEIVWRLRVRGVSGKKHDFEKFFYKAQRIAPH